eukprot:Tbor_TRINITY_DN3055_c0_g1::TRINITY_DN3055_c0_g1_i1::g.17357::m.17357
MIRILHYIILFSIVCATTSSAGGPTTYELLTTNYASAFLGARIADHHHAAKQVHNILNDNKEKYMNIPCSAESKRFTIQLAKDIQLNMFSLSNLEYFSSSIKHFTLLGSRTYPCMAPCKWRVLGNYKAKLTRSQQSFLVPKQAVIRYLRILWVSRYSREKSCTMTSFQAYGTDVIENLAAELAGDGGGPLGPDSVPDNDAFSDLGHNSNDNTFFEDTKFPNGVSVDENGVLVIVPPQNMSHSADGQLRPLDRPADGSSSTNTQQHYINVTKIIRLQNIEYPLPVKTQNTSSPMCMINEPASKGHFGRGAMCTAVTVIQRIPVSHDAMVRRVPIRSHIDEPELMPLSLVKHIKALQYTVAALVAQNATMRRHINYMTQEINILKEQLTRERTQWTSAIEEAVDAANRKYDLMTTQTQLQLLELEHTVAVKYTSIMIWSSISLVVALSALFCVTLQSRAAIPGQVLTSYRRNDSVLSVFSPRQSCKDHVKDDDSRSLDEISPRGEVSDEVYISSPNEKNNLWNDTTSQMYTCTHDVNIGNDFMDVSPQLVSVKSAPNLTVLGDIIM